LLSPYGFANTASGIDGSGIKAGITSVTGTDSLDRAITLAADDYSVDTLTPTNFGNTTATLRVPAARSSTGADITANFNVYIKSWAKAITAFYFTIDGKHYGVKSDAVSGSGTINHETRIITVTVPYGADPATFPNGPDLTTLKPTVDHSALSSIDPYDEFWDPSATTYKVTAEDGTDQSYAVTATVAPGITINAINYEGLSTLTFTGTDGSSPLTPLSTVTVAPSTSITITLSGGTNSTWHIDANGVEIAQTTSTDTTVTFVAPSAPRFYNVTVLATVGGVEYSGSFGLVVK
jgi:hypothetical protein